MLKNCVSFKNKILCSTCNTALTVASTAHTCLTGSIRYENWPGVRCYYIHCGYSDGKTHKDVVDYWWSYQTPTTKSLMEVRYRHDLKSRNFGEYKIVHYSRIKTLKDQCRR